MSETKSTYTLSPSLFIILAVALTTGGSKLWRDPATVAEVGGFAYIVIFSFFVLIIGLPVLFCEILLGKLGQSSNPVTNIEALAGRASRSRYWGITGYLAAFSSLLIAGLVCSICPWGFTYLWHYLDGTFYYMNEMELYELFMSSISAGPANILASMGLGVITFLVLSQPPNIRFNRMLKPITFLLLALLFVLLVYALVIGKFFTMYGTPYSPENGPSGTDLAVNTFETIDFSRIDWNTVKSAMFNAFHSVSVGFLVILSLSHYLKKGTNALTITARAGFSSFFIIQLVSIALLPLILMADPEDRVSGALLWFVQLPKTLALLPGGMQVGVISCLIVILAMISSSLLLMETPVSVLQGKLKLSRNRAAALAAILMSLISMGCLFSSSIQDFVDMFSSSVLTPSVVMLTVIFVAWRLPRNVVATALPSINAKKPKRSYNLLRLPGVISAVGTAFGFVVSKFLAILLSDEQEFLPVLVFALLFAISVYWDLYSWQRKPLRGSVKPMTLKIVMFWIRFVTPFLAMFILIFSIWNYIR